MLINCKEFTSEQIYFLMVQTIVPRPIAWVLSDNGNATYNLAPFSFFNGISSEPPLLMISVGLKSDGSRKDTWINIAERNDFVVHVPSVELIHHVVDSSASLPHGVSEVKELNLKIQNVENWCLPRVVGPKVVFFCQKHHIYEVGNSSEAVIFGEIKAIWLDDSIVKDKKDRIRIDYEQLDPLARLGGSFYSRLGEQICMKRPP